MLALLSIGAPLLTPNSLKKKFYKENLKIILVN